MSGFLPCHYTPTRLFIFHVNFVYSIVYYISRDGGSVWDTGQGYLCMLLSIKLMSTLMGY